MTEELIAKMREINPLGAMVNEALDNPEKVRENAKRAHAMQLALIHEAIEKGLATPEDVPHWI